MARQPLSRLFDELPEKKSGNPDVPNPRALDPKKVNLFRRKFLTGAGLAGAALALGGPSSKILKSARAFYPSPFNDVDILNFALNLEYLEAEFYLRATTGSGLANNEVTGVGTLGAVTGGSQVPFAIPAIQAYAESIANDEHNHVLALRGALGNAAVARPTINLQHSFTAAAVAAGILQPGQRFDPYADDSSFALSAFVFEDVGVTAYHGAAPLIANEAILSAAAGILAVEAYHAGSIRTVLYQLGQSNAQLISDANAISALRAGADAMQPNGHETALTVNGMPQIVASDPSDSIAYARTFNEVLRIVYLGNKAGQGGGFFPAGLNGTIR